MGSDIQKDGSSTQRKIRYARAPIVEALVDIRTALPDRIGPDDLARGMDGEEGGYPERRPSSSIEAKVSFGSALDATASQTSTGFHFVSADGRQIAQFRTDGFTFSRLAPYTSWEEVGSEARRLWQRYRRVAHPRLVTRIAVKYINRIELPVTLGDFNEYLRTTPEVSPDLPQGLSGFLMQLQIPLHSQPPDTQAIITEAMLPRDKADSFPVLLDIDVFKVASWPGSSRAVWSELELIHEREGEIFEGCITDAARRLFDASP